MCLYVCFFVCLYEYGLPPRIKLAASNCSRRFISVQGKNLTFLWTLFPQKPKIGRSSKRAGHAHPHVNITIEMRRRKRHARDARFVKLCGVWTYDRQSACLYIGQSHWRTCVYFCLFWHFIIWCCLLPQSNFSLDDYKESLYNYVWLGTAWFTGAGHWCI